VSATKPQFIICGSGRSGTSAVARLLHEAGLSVGHELIEPDEHNAEGYFEERQVVKINVTVSIDIRRGEGLSDALRWRRWRAGTCKATAERGKIAGVDHAVSNEVRRTVTVVRENGSTL